MAQESVVSVFLGKLVFAQLVKKFPLFLLYANFVTVFTSSSCLIVY